MRNLLYKDFKLATHPTTYLFLLFGAMLLIPSYPYYVAFMYMCLAVFFVFLNGRENGDVMFSVSLPVAKGDTVRARCAMVALMETAQILCSIPFAIISTKVLSASNQVGMDVNPALYGFVFIMFGLFNLLFLPTFYKDGYQAGRALLVGGVAVLVYILVMEAATYVVPFMMALDTTAAAQLGPQLVVLGVGIAVFICATLIACAASVKRFEKVDI